MSWDASRTAGYRGLRCMIKADSGLIVTGGFYHGARRDARAERPKEVILEDCSSDERKGGLQFLLDESADSPSEECETLRASRCVARSQPLD
eukprot:scaffold54137_cov67-Phaeocystis_antarctica.AAC.2